MRNSLAILSQANATFPNLDIAVLDDRPDRTLDTRLIGRYPVTLLRSPATTIQAVGDRSLAAGLGNHLKLIWQLGGRMRYEDDTGSFILDPGQMAVTAMDSDYRLEMHEGHEALIVAFDRDDDASWPALSRRVLATSVAATAGIRAAAGGVVALLSNAVVDATEEIAVRTMIDLALISAQPAEARQPPLVARATEQIVRNVGDMSYGPERLARDLGMSRRSLYHRLGSHGVTPAALIRRTRLDHARWQISKNDGRSLIDIAVENGFSGGASLSHAFRDAYGRAPSAFRSGS